MSKSLSLKKICLVPRLEGLGGPSSFQARLRTGLAQRGIEVTYDLADPGCSSLLVIGGSARLDQLWWAKRRGLRIVQRLDGMNWVHRLRKTGLRHYLRSEINNTLLRTIRKNLADCIAYQSHFSKTWWERVYGPLSIPDTVIYNGVDLAMFTPAGPGTPPKDCLRLQVVEGHLGGGNEAGLLSAVHLARELTVTHSLPVELAVIGDVPERLRGIEQELPHGRVKWMGILPRQDIPQADRSAHLLFSADINAACPNAVIEALACGLPVVAFDTGALPEMVQGGAGEVVPYGGDVWKLEPPDIPALAAASAQILTNQPSYRAKARQRAEAEFGLDQMVEKYIHVFL